MFPISKPFVCQDTTLILFGKFKGKKFEVFKDPENAGYVDWLKSTMDPIKSASLLLYLSTNNL